MIIYSWNILDTNKKLDEAFRFITTTPFDIFCLQEVPEAFLVRLQATSFYGAFQSESEDIYASHITKKYSVTLSKYPIQNEGKIVLADWPVQALHAKIISFILCGFRSIISVDRAALYSDIEINGIRTRIFNLHLGLRHPRLRADDFDRAMIFHTTLQTNIICGDFNILESPHISILNVLLGGYFREALFYKQERASMEEKFIHIAMNNPLRGKVTHSIAQSQLDHILVPNSLNIKEASVIKNRFGSDHYPVKVVLE